MAEVREIRDLCSCSDCQRAPLRRDIEWGAEGDGSLRREQSGMGAARCPASGTAWRTDLPVVGTPDRGDRVVTAVETVRMVGACPSCGGDAQWTGSHVPAGDGTEWRIDCGWCDAPAWSLAAQIARRNRRVA